MSPTPLAGLRVLESGPLLPVPATGEALRRLGADVIRVEPPTGDPARRLYGGWLFELYGADKASIALDLRRADDAERLNGEIERADVVIVGHRPAAAARLGLDRASVRARRPAAVYCAIVGRASEDPDRDRPGHDLSFLAACGALTEAAGPSAEGAAPHRPAPPVGDLAASAVATQAILAALLTDDPGAYPIEVAIADCAAAFMAPRLGGHVDAGFGPALDPANDIYECADGRWIAIAAIEPKFWTALVDRVFGDDPDIDGLRQLGSAERIADRDAWAVRLSERFRGSPSDDWVDGLRAVGVPIDEVRTGAEYAATVGDDLDRWRDRANPLSGVWRD